MIIIVILQQILVYLLAIALAIGSILNITPTASLVNDSAYPETTVTEKGYDQLVQFDKVDSFTSYTENYQYEITDEQVDRYEDKFDQLQKNIDPEDKTKLIALFEYNDSLRNNNVFVPYGSIAEYVYLNFTYTEKQLEYVLNQESLIFPNNDLNYYDDTCEEFSKIQEIFEYNDDNLYDFLSNYSDKNQILVNYQIIGDEIIFSNTKLDLEYSKENYQRYYDQIVFLQTIIPEELFSYISDVEFCTDGTDNTLAYVYPIDDTNSKYAIGIDLMDNKELPDDSFTFLTNVVHEFGHILSLNSSQLVLPNVYHFDGDIDREFRKDSYLGKFYHEFWSKGMRKEYENCLDEFPGEDGIEKFYLNHEDDFVSSYAATSVKEDFAESFMAYVCYDFSTTEDKDAMYYQKVMWFEQFPEIKDYAWDIIENYYTNYDD